MWPIRRRRNARTALTHPQVAGRADMTAVTPLCLLLAGGKSRRMGGGDKNLFQSRLQSLLSAFMYFTACGGTKIRNKPYFCSATTVVILVI